MPPLRLHLIIRGRVQGVFFRAFVKSTADELGITGFVRNTPNDSVEIVAEGSEEQLKYLLARCKHGPPAAKVDSIEEKQSKATGEFSVFDVVY